MTVAEITETRSATSGSSESALHGWVRALEATAPITQQPWRLLLDIIAERARTQGDTPALISERETLTYQELVARANRYARWALSQDLRKGETVCLMMPNRPDYLAIWLGVTSVGGVVALINTQLRGPSLAHCVDLVAPRHVIVAADLSDALQTAGLSRTPKIWPHGGGNLPRIDCTIENFSSAPARGMEYELSLFKVS